MAVKTDLMENVVKMAQLVCRAYRVTLVFRDRGVQMAQRVLVEPLGNVVKMEVLEQLVLAGPLAKMAKKANRGKRVKLVIQGHRDRRDLTDLREPLVRMVREVRMA